MKTTNIEIRKITFNNFEFKVNESEEIERDGKATISMDLPDREANQNNQIILINMNVDYKDSRYSILAEIDSVY